MTSSRWRAASTSCAQPEFRTTWPRVATLPTMYGVFDVVEVSEDSGLLVGGGGRSLGALLGLHLHWLRDRVVDLWREDRWKALARAALRDDLYTIHRAAHRQGAPRRPAARAAARAGGRLGGGPAGRGALPPDGGGHSRRPDFDLTTLSVAVRESAQLVG